MNPDIPERPTPLPPPAMKVVHLTSAHPVFDARIFQRECRSLARLGYEVVLIAPHQCDEIVDGVDIRHVQPHPNRLLRMTSTTLGVYRRALREKADVYHFHDPELILAGLLLRMAGRRVIYDIHEDLPRTIAGKFYFPGWCRPPIKWAAESLENLACRSFSGLVAATPTIAERFYRVNSRTTVVCNFPVLDDMPTPAVRWEDRQMSVAYIGNITVERGIIELVKALSLLPADSPARLLLAGKFWPESLHQQLAQLRGWGRVDYVGLVSPKKIPSLLARVRAGLVVLAPQENYLRSMPIKLFEYMAAGIPVIASNFPFWRQIVEGAQCGVLVDPTNPPAIAQAICSLLTSPERAQEMGTRGRKAAEITFNWKNQEPRLRALYDGRTDTTPLVIGVRAAA
jgi:glycosyltransferase involved in cell wall biosynthesis